MDLVAINYRVRGNVSDNGAESGSIGQTTLTTCSMSKGVYCYRADEDSYSVSDILTTNGSIFTDRG